MSKCEHPSSDHRISYRVNIRITWCGACGDELNRTIQRYTAYAMGWHNGHFDIQSGQILVGSDNQYWEYQSTTHPRKVNVMQKIDPNGEDSYPNKLEREFFANVFNLGIWDNELKEWSFRPSWKNVPEDPTKRI